MIPPSLAFILVSLFSLFGLVSTAAVVTTKNITVVSFNVLAPCWASSTYYPASSVSKLDRVYRRGRIINYLNQAVASGASVIALQEVQIDEYPYFLNALKASFDGNYSLHDDNYWASWITTDPPFARNGNALFLKRDVFDQITFSDRALSNEGNHCVLATAREKTTLRSLRIASVHLDSDNSSRRNNELTSLMNQLPAQANVIDILAGDYNAALSSGNLANVIKVNNFLNALDVLGIAEQTHPFTSSYNRNTNWGPIDHIAYRNCKVTGNASVSNDGSPVIENGVVDFSVWKLYPSGSTYEAQRISQNFDNCGSDHFPVKATLLIQ
mmetsp:Transcript_18558/g.26319  ORF Transcript_18558/g.26319 Transcript_18558/m.26319 type:complete len:326 (+) Transcript_18558:95-1072(+)|eukprot:CAMPEP_0172420770 /NCGR_PEP_ID=MMETSP1064-20121228/7111_1 /TAXON_ID=202472 /ORGANISM="Aulacoseira subarctica , Strain CCAP 1002/5" /LENGTH=325 /DNA_ID=CAMNT_0013160873 /DNA_START=54 /DNA_END=1031 /DNA_ORIENTATION=+